MRRAFLALPWEEMGDRLALVSLTYPNEWRDWVRDGRVLEKHRREFLDRWRTKFGTRGRGVWVKEFQNRGAPHLHLYLSVPDEVELGDWLGLVRRTVLRKELEKELGKYEGRKKTPVIGGEYGGEFGTWLRDAWSGVVGTKGVRSKEANLHHGRGVDVAVSFFSEQAAQKNRLEVAMYLMRESGKWTQKEPPEWFGPVGRWWNYWGMKPREVEVELPGEVAWRIIRVLERWVRLGARSRGVSADWLEKRAPGQGLTAEGMTEAQGQRLLMWAWAAAERAQERRREAAASGASRPCGPGETTTMPPEVDLETGEILG